MKNILAYEVDKEPHTDKAYEPLDSITENNAAYCYENRGLSNVFADLFVTKHPRIELGSLTKIGAKPTGMKEGGIYFHPQEGTLFVKDSELGPLTLSYLMSKLGKIACPDQVVDTIPVIDTDTGNVMIGSPKVDGFSRYDDRVIQKEMGLHLCLDLMNIGDRHNDNLGVVPTQLPLVKLAYAIDIDTTAEFEDGWFERKNWLDKTSAYTNFCHECLKSVLHEGLQSQAGYNALEAISKIPDEEINTCLRKSYGQLSLLLPKKYQDLFSEIQINLSFV